MTGAPIAAGLLLAVLAFALAFLPRRLALGCAVVAALAALAVPSVFTLPSQIAFAGCWVSLALAALSVYWPRPAQGRAWLCLLFALNAGAWAGLVAAIDTPEQAALPILPVLLLTIPATWCVDRGWALAPRVVTSWLLAVAMLVGAIPHLVTHPGYVPDHRV